nr:hypothetical protein [Fretibacterium sp.]
MDERTQKLIYSGESITDMDALNAYAKQEEARFENPAPQKTGPAPAADDREQRAQDVFTGVNMFPTAEETKAAVETLPGVQQALKEQYADILTLQYPKWEKKIQKARGYGYSDEEIRNFMVGKESMSLMYYSQDKVNQYLQRTPEGMELAAAAERRRMTDAYVQASGLEREDVEDRMFVASMLGMPSSFLIKDKDLYNSLKPEFEQRLNKMRQAWWNAEPGIWGNVAAPTIAGAGQTLNSTFIKGTGFMAAQAAPAYNDTIRWGLQLLQPFLNDIGLTPDKTAVFYSRENNAIEQTAKWMLAKGNEYGKAINDWYTQEAGENPSFTAETMHNVGSSLAFLVSVLTNPLYGASMESLGEAGDVMARALENGEYDKSITPAALSFITNMVANYAWDKMGFFNPLLDKIKNPYLRGWARVISGVPFEIGQESGQEVISNTADRTVEQGGTLTDFAKNLWKEGKNFWDIAKEMAPTIGASTIITGGVGATIRGRMEYKQEKKEREAYEAVKKEWDSLTPEQKAEKNKEVRETIIKEASKNPLFHSEEAEATRDRMTRQFENGGMDGPIARADAEVATAAGIVMLAREPDILIEKDGQKVKPTLDDMTNFVVQSWQNSARVRQEEQYEQIIGEKGAAKLDAVDRQGRIDNLSVARQMEKTGKDARTIWLATGWNRGTDGKWGYDILDGEIKLPDLSLLSEAEKNEYDTLMERLDKGEELSEADEKRLEELDEIQTSNRNEGAEKYNTYTLGDIYDAPELYAAYPELKDMPVVFGDLQNDRQGEYYSGNISLSRDYLKTHATQAVKHTLVHEIQHAVQHIEGFAKGGNTEQFRLEYDLHSGYLRRMMDALQWAEKDAGIDDFIDKSVREMHEGKKTIDQHWKDLEEFKSSIAPEIAEDIDKYKNLVDQIIQEWRTKYGTAETPEQIYLRLVGEVQARNASTRMDMTAEERRNTPLADTEDVRREDQILLDSYEESYGQERTNASKQLGPQAEAKLAADEKAFGEAVDKVLSGTINEREHVKVMTTPLVFTLTGAKIFPVYMEGSKIKTVVNGPHGITQDIVKQLPRALADPVAIFTSKTHPDNSIVVMTEIIDADGGTVIVPIELNKEQDEYRVNRLSSVYAKKNDKTGEVKNEWFVTQVNEGRLRYIDREKSSQWSIQTGLQLPVGSTSENGISIPNETDLAKLRNQPGNETFYQEQQRSGETVNGTTTGWIHGQPGQEAWNVPSVITFFQTANASTGLHELGHHMLRLMMDISKLEGASAQIKADVNTILTHAGVTMEEFDTDRDKRKQAHEYFARSWETYLSEGRAPTPELQGVFDRIREWMIEVYHDVVQALGIELSDEMRDVFDRLLATPDQIAEQRRIGNIAMEELARRDEMKHTAEEIKELETTTSERGNYPAEWDEVEPDPRGEEYDQIIGERGAARLDAADAGNRIDNLGVAREMEEAGKDAKAIWLATGWQKGKDGKWNYDILDGAVEIPDGRYLSEPEQSELEWLIHRENNGEKLSDADQNRLNELSEALDKVREKYQRSKKYTLGDIYKSPVLYNAYPELKNIPISFEYLGERFGSLLPSGEIVLNWDLKDNFIKDVLVHEIQHKIQSAEGFAPGGNREIGEKFSAENWKRVNELNHLIKEKSEEASKLLEEVFSGFSKLYPDVNGSDKKFYPLFEEYTKTSEFYKEKNAAYKKADEEKWRLIKEKEWRSLVPFSGDQTYEHLAGEVQARNVETRMNMTAEERRQKMLSETEDVSREDQIVLMDALDGGESFSQTDTSAPAQMTESEVDEMTRGQLDAVRKRYEGTGQYMKAPNGKDTNLTEKQWLQVRTPAFKQWFGDWEAAATKDRLVNGDAVTVQDDGNDLIEGKETEWRKLVDDYSKNVQGVSKQLFNFLRSIIPQTITNVNIGAIGFTNNSIRNSLHHKDGKANAIVLPYIKNILESAELVGTRAIDGDRTSYILAKPLEYKGQRFIMLMVVNEDAQGKKYYDHEFTTIEKIDGLQTVLRNSKTTELLQNHQSLLSILAEDVWNNNSSKVVDENGEPLVVYHGSPKWFTVFNDGTQQKNSKAPDGTIFMSDNRQIANSFILGNWYGKSDGQESTQA